MQLKVSRFRVPLDPEAASLLEATRAENRALKARVQRLEAEVSELAVTGLSTSRTVSAVLRIDAEQQIVAATRQACTLYRCERDTMVGASLGRIRVGYDLSWPEIWERVTAGEIIVCEEEHRRKDGTSFPVELIVSTSDDDGEEPCDVIIRDLSERRQAEQLISEVARGISASSAQGSFHNLLESLARVLRADYVLVGEMMAGPVERVRTVALLADGEEAPEIEYDLAGTPCENVVGREACVVECDVQERFPADSLLRDMGAQSYVGAPLFSATREPLGLLAALWRRPLESADQAKLLLQIFAARAAGELERLRAEASLRQSESLLRSIIDHTTAIIYVKNRDNTYLLANREFQRAIGWDFEQIRARGDAGMFPGYITDELRDNDREVFESGHPKQCEERLADSNNEIRTFLSVKVPLLDQRERPWAVATIATDITEHKDREAQRLHAQRMESVGRLAGGIAHEFNNLLTSIIGYIDLIERALPPDHPTRPDLEESRQAGLRAATLTSQLLTFARVQVSTPQTVDLASVMDEVASMMEAVTDESTSIEVHVDDDLWPALVDPQQIEQVLLNLALNAHDAMPEGGCLTMRLANVHLESTLGSHGSAVLPGDYVEVLVSDTGSGIEESVRSRIFEPFFTTKVEGDGTGLGLAMSHGIVHQSGGLMDFETELGVGTTFRVLLPRSR